MRTQDRRDTAAQQVDGWDYDAAGNLLRDAIHTYNGDGVLVAGTTAGGVTTYVQDLVAPLRQVLELTHGSSHTTYSTGVTGW